MLNRAEGQRTM